MWVAARMDSARIPAGGMRVSQVNPRRLGVHEAIRVPGVSDEVPPEYVPRDADDGESGLRAKVAAAAERGGFVLLVGGSSVGKSRCAFEAVTALLPDWWLVHPAGPDQIAALAQAPTPRTVVWLDELQRYLDGEHGLTGGVVRALLNAPHPVVIIGTMWPDFYAAPGYTVNRSSLVLWSIRVPGGTTRARRESSWPGSAPMRTAWTTWSGCAGPEGSRARRVVTPAAGGWAMAGASAAAAGGVPR